MGKETFHFTLPDTEKNRELHDRLKKIALYRSKNLGDLVEAAVHQFVVNQERFILTLQRKEHRKLNRQIYSYCPLCLCQVSVAYTRRKEKGKQMRVKIGFYCGPCEILHREPLEFTEVKRIRNPDATACDICGKLLKSVHGLKVHHYKIHSDSPGLEVQSQYE